MAIYHFSAKIISRGTGRSAVAAAAYRAAERLHDDRLGRAHDFTNKSGVVHSEVMRPEGAPERLADRATLWNAVEAAEKRKDAQLAREVELAIPREMTKDQTRQQATFTQRDLAKFAQRHSDGHAQFEEVLSSMRHHPSVVALGRDGRDEDRFTTRAVLTTEQRLVRDAGQLVASCEHVVSRGDSREPRRAAGPRYSFIN